MVSNKQNCKQEIWIENVMEILAFLVGSTIHKRHTSLQNCYKLLYIATCFINIVGFIVGTLNNSPYKLKFVTIIMTLIYISTLTLFLVEAIGKQEISDSLLQHYDPADPKYLGRNVTQTATKIVKKDVLQWCAHYCITIALLLSSILMVFKDREMSHSDTEIDEFHEYFLPLWFSCGDKIEHSTSGWLCWKVRDNRELLYLNMIQLVLFMNIMVYYYSLIIGVQCVSKTLDAMGITLKMMIKAIEKNTTEIVTVRNPHSHKSSDYSRRCILRYDIVVYDEFKKVLKEQQRIRK